MEWSTFIHMQFDTIIGQPINKLRVSGYINIYNRDGR